MSNSPTLRGFSGTLIATIALCKNFPPARLDLAEGRRTISSGATAPLQNNPRAFGIADQQVLGVLIVVERHLVGLAAETRFLIPAESAWAG